jgi:hypothetical protein
MRSAGSRPNSSARRRRTSGTRVEPPTHTTSVIAAVGRPVAVSTLRVRSIVRST